MNDSEDESPKKLSKKADEKPKKKKKSVTFADTEDTDKGRKPSDTKTSNPLITDLDPRPIKDKRTMKANLWFEKVTFTS